MDPVANPYQPSAGVRPRELAGRDTQLADMDILIGRAERGFVSRSIVYSGLRGVGKTVLLNEFAARARDRGWIVAQLEGPSDFDLGRDAENALRAKLARALHSSMREALGRWKRSDVLHRAAGVFKSFTLSLEQSGNWTVGIDMAPLRGRADTGHLEVDLPELAVDLAQAAITRGVGVLVCVDEMQQLSRTDLAALCTACHEAGQRELPFYLAGAGLPNVAPVLADAKSYAERLFDYVRLGPLDAEQTRRALAVPSTALGVRWRRAALDLVAEQSAGYPYFVQAYGAYTWDAAVGPSTVTVEDARVGIALAAEHLDRGFYLARWERATPFQRVYLRAMAEDGDGPSTSAALAERLGRTVGGLGPVRSELIAKGLIYAPERGRVCFTVPGMAGFIARRP